MAKRDYSHRQCHLFTQNFHTLAHIRYVFDVIAENPANSPQKELAGITSATRRNPDPMDERKPAGARKGASAWFLVTVVMATLLFIFAAVRPSPLCGH